MGCLCPPQRIGEPSIDLCLDREVVKPMSGAIGCDLIEASSYNHWNGRDLFCEVLRDSFDERAGDVRQLVRPNGALKATRAEEVDYIPVLKHHGSHRVAIHQYLAR